MRYRRRGEDEYGPGSNGWEDPDFPLAMSNYGAAVRGMDPGERPGFRLDEWVDEWGGPSVPDWVPEPPSAPLVEEAGGWGRLVGHRSDHCMSMRPGCQGECGG